MAKRWFVWILAALLLAAGLSAAADDAEVALTSLDARRVAEDPEAFEGKVYENVFYVLQSAVQMDDGTYVVVSLGIYAGGLQDMPTILVFAEDPGLKPDDLVYAYGVVGGLGAISTGDGEQAEVIFLDVDSFEREMGSDTGLFTAKATVEYPSAAATDGALTIRVASFTFEADKTTLITNTLDTSVEEFQTYYMDMVLHQGGYFTFFGKADYWINPGQPGFDSLLFPPMDASQPVVCQFFVYDEEQNPLYGALSVTAQP